MQLYKKLDATNEFEKTDAITEASTLIEKISAELDSALQAVLESNTETLSASITDRIQEKEGRSEWLSEVIMRTITGDNGDQVRAALAAHYSLGDNYPKGADDASGLQFVKNLFSDWNADGGGKVQKDQAAEIDINQLQTNDTVTIGTDGKIVITRDTTPEP